MAQQGYGLGACGFLDPHIWDGAADLSPAMPDGFIAFAGTAVSETGVTWTPTVEFKVSLEGDCIHGLMSFDQAEQVRDALEAALDASLDAIGKPAKVGIMAEEAPHMIRTHLNTDTRDRT